MSRETFPGPPGRRISLEALLDLKEWQKIQDLFSEIIGANIRFLDPSASLIIRPSRKTPFCHDWEEFSPKAKVSHFQCLLRILDALAKGIHLYHCPLGPHYYSIPIHLTNEPLLGSLVIGPLVTGPRKSQHDLEQIAQEFDLDPETYLESFKDLRVFSFSSLQAVGRFLEEQMTYLLRFGKERCEKDIEKESPLPKLAGLIDVGRTAQSLLEIALLLVDGDSGSVLLFDHEKEKYLIKTARGLEEPYIKNTAVGYGEGIAGWVAEKATAVLLDEDFNEEEIRREMTRPEILASMVIPLKFQDRTLGILCLNALKENSKFNSGNLKLLKELGELTGAALWKAMP